MCKKENSSAKKVIIQTAFCSVLTGFFFVISIIAAKFGIWGYNFPEFSGKNKILYILKCFYIFILE